MTSHPESAQANAELVLKSIEALNAGDTEGLANARNPHRSAIRQR